MCFECLAEGLSTVGFCILQAGDLVSGSWWLSLLVSFICNRYTTNTFIVGVATGIVPCQLKIYQCHHRMLLRRLVMFCSQPTVQRGRCFLAWAMPSGGRKRLEIYAQQSMTVGQLMIRMPGSLALVVIRSMNRSMGISATTIRFAASRASWSVNYLRNTDFIHL